MKSFLGVSDLRDLEQASVNSRFTDSCWPVKNRIESCSLAITRAACENLFEDAAGRELVASEKLRLWCSIPETERLLEWIKTRVMARS